MAQSRSPPPFPTTELSPEIKEKQNDEDDQEQQALGSLPEDALVEILSRVPYSSLCRFKSVSKPWLALCSAPDIYKRSPQTLSGFFHRYTDYPQNLRFLNLSGRGPPLVEPSLPFLLNRYVDVIPTQCCAGLVLSRCWKWRLGQYSLVVCNPLTEKWTELPPCLIEFSDEDAPYHEIQEYLCFDPATPSRFVVFAYFWESEELTIYSSEIGRWATVQSGWAHERSHIGQWECVFLNGSMHLLTAQHSILTVDTEGKVWREFDIPGNLPEKFLATSIGQSQGRLYACCIDDPNACQLSVWALNDYASVQWTLKHTVNILELFGRHCRKDDENYKMVAIHPDHNVIFLSDQKEKTISYDMDTLEVRIICTSQLVFCVHPYIPCFAELPSDGH